MTHSHENDVPQVIADMIKKHVQGSKVNTILEFQRIIVEYLQTGED